MNALILGAMMAMSPIQAQTDTIVAVGDAEKVHVETLGGSIRVLVWDEQRVRIQAEHSNRTYIDINTGSREIHIESEARRGPANIVDFIITVPRRMSLELEANYGDITIEGADGEVQAETVQGDVSIIGGRGVIEVEATTGSIMVDGADGKIDIESSAADIRVVNSSGEIYAETAGGTIVMENVDPTSVDVGSTGGRVHYDGALRPGGTYFFGAHGGSITIVVGEEARASFNVATVHGSITSNLSGTAQSLKGRERHQFEVGGGGAIVEAETYGGRIRILRRGSEGTAAPARRMPNRDGDGVVYRDAFDGPDGFDWRVPESDAVSIAVDVAVAPAVDLAIAEALSASLAPAIDHAIGPRLDAALAPAVDALHGPRIAARLAPVVAVPRPDGEHRHEAPVRIPRR